MTRNRSDIWLLQDAKARFSEVIRRAQSEGPQHVTMHGREAVVVVSTQDYRRLSGDLTGQALVTALQASPYRDIDLDSEGMAMPVRDATLCQWVGSWVPTSCHSAAPE